MNLTNCLPKSVVSRCIIPCGETIPARSALSSPAALSSLAMSMVKSLRPCISGRPASTVRALLPVGVGWGRPRDANHAGGSSQSVARRRCDAVNLSTRFRMIA
jgi:hypothetical protein